jgi:hypothetical protein
VALEDALSHQGGAHGTPNIGGGSVEAIEVALEDALSHRGRGPAGPALRGAQGGGAPRLAVTPEGETVLCGADGRVGGSVGWRALAISWAHEGAAAEGEPAQEPLAALVVGIGKSCVRVLSEAPGNNSARAAGM